MDKKDVEKVGQFGVRRAQQIRRQYRDVRSAFDKLQVAWLLVIRVLRLLIIYINHPIKHKNRATN